MQVLVCVATSYEARACRQGIQEAGLEHDIEILTTGMGFENARAGLLRRLRQSQGRAALLVRAGAPAYSAHHPNMWTTPTTRDSSPGTLP